MQRHCTPLLGLPQFDSWANFHLSNDSRFLFLISVVGPGAENAGKKLSNIAFETEIESPANLHRLGVLLGETAKEQAVGLSFILAFFENGSATFMSKSASILLKRGEKVGFLLQAEKEAKIITGKLHLEDVLVLSNAASRGFLPEVEQKFASGFETETIVTTLLPSLRSDNQSSRQAMVFIEIRQELIDSSQEIAGRKQELVGSELEREELPAENLETEQFTKIEKPARQRPKMIQEIGRRVIWFFSALIQILLALFSLGRTLLQRGFRRGVYLEDGVANNRQRRFFALLFITVLIVAAAGIFFWQYRARQLRRAETFIVELEDKLSSAKTVLEEDPISARQEVEAILSELDSLELRFEKQSFAKNRIQEFDSQVEEYYEKISGREEFQELPVFFDLRLREDDFIASRVDLLGNRAVFLDPGQKKLIVLNLDTKESESIDLSELENIKDLCFDGERALMLADGIYSVDLATGNASKLIEQGDSNQAATLLSYFARFIYVFNAEKRNIYRYSEGEEGYSDPIGWLQNKQGLDFTTVRDLAIDGDLWLSTEDGSIIKYTQGNPTEFEIRGLGESFASQIQIFTKTDYENIYILDSEKQRLVVLSKEGNLVKELQSSMLESATELIVNQDETSAFAISGSLLYELEL